MTYQDLEKTIEDAQDLSAERRGLAKEFGKKKSRVSKLDKRSRQLMHLVSHGFSGGGL